MLVHPEDGRQGEAFSAGGWYFMKIASWSGCVLLPVVFLFFSLVLEEPSLGVVAAIMAVWCWGLALVARPARFVAYERDTQSLRLRTPTRGMTLRPSDVRNVTRASSGSNDVTIWLERRTVIGGLALTVGLPSDVAAEFADAVLARSA